jgi:hypothetical protein
MILWAGRISPSLHTKYISLWSEEKRRFLYVFATTCGIVTVGISRAKGGEISWLNLSCWKTLMRGLESQTGRRAIPISCGVSGGAAATSTARPATKLVQFCTCCNGQTNMPIAHCQSWSVPCFMIQRQLKAGETWMGEKWEGEVCSERTRCSSIRSLPYPLIFVQWDLPRRKLYLDDFSEIWFNCNLEIIPAD